MVKTGLYYLKLPAVVAVLAIALIALNGRLSRTTVARENGTTTPREIGLTPAQRFSERAATVLATEVDTTTPTLPTTLSCFFQTQPLHITEINKVEGSTGNTIIEVRWDFRMPPEIGSTNLHGCVSLDYFDVQIFLTFKNGSEETHSKKVSPPAQNAPYINAVFVFNPALRDLKSVRTQVNAHYIFTGGSSDTLSKNF